MKEVGRAKNYGKCDRSGMRTHDTEVTGALNQRLRPLGHPAVEVEGREKKKCDPKSCKTRGLMGTKVAMQA